MIIMIWGEYMIHGERYVNEDGTPYVKKEIDKKKIMMIGAIILIVIFLVLIITNLVTKAKKNNACDKMENTLLDAAYKYASEKKLLPNVGGESIKVSSSDLLKEDYITNSDLTYEEEVGTATITITKYKEEYIKSVEIENCGYCTSRYKDWGKETDKYDEDKHVVDVQATYNYYDRATYYTKYTDYIESSEVSAKKSKYGTYLPKNEDILPEIPSTGVVVTIEQEQKTYYSYRDKKWRYYQNNNCAYSAFSSEQPAGYKEKDKRTVKYSEWSKWSINYPDEKDYRHIERTTGYRWYYKEGGEKIYYNSGEYTPEQPSPKYTERERKSVTMYRYRDEMWRWRNDCDRKYTSLTSRQTERYPYRDEETLEYTNWTSWRDESTVTSENSYYREQREDQHSRYRIKYDIYSLIKLDESLSKEDFEKKMGRSLDEIANDPTIALEITYIFRYK